MSNKPHTPVRAKGVVHHLIAETAKGIAAVVYEDCASADDAFFKLWPNQNEFVRRRWKSFIQPARETLADMLHPSKHYLTTEHMRREIHEALLLNAAANPAINSPLH